LLVTTPVPVVVMLIGVLTKVSRPSTTRTSWLTCAPIGELPPGAALGDPATDNSKANVAPGWKVTVLFTVRVPEPLPGATVAPDAAVTGALTVPAPPRTAKSLTATLAAVSCPLMRAAAVLAASNPVRL